MISFRIPMKAIPKGRPRVTRSGHAYTPKRTRDFEREFRYRAMAYKPPKPLHGDLYFEVTFYFKRAKRTKHAKPYAAGDLDNLVKSVTDPLNGIFWTDDDQITQWYAEKDYSTGEAYIDIKIGERKDGGII